MISRCPASSRKAGLRGGADAGAAGCFATAARLGALLAMLHVSVLFALVATGLADFGTLAQQVHSVDGAPRN